MRTKLKRAAELPALMKADDVAAFLSVSRSTLYNRVKAGELPRPVKLGTGRAVFWRRSDLLEVIENAVADAA